MPQLEFRARLLVFVLTGLMLLLLAWGILRIGP